MFFLHEIERIVNLHPSYFGPKMEDEINKSLTDALEGKNMGSYFVLCILQNWEISEGRCVPGTGTAEYTVHLKAVVWKPFRGEIVDGRVKNVIENGFFVEIGPLSCFVNKNMIPSDMVYDGNATPPQWTDNADQVIEKGTQVRLKIKGIRGEIGDMFSIGTIKEDYLGLLS
ncbi:DNA-directed RNA polymerase II 19 kDa polypeptide [Aulographum hederae CBS 113979]|uniref:DNA-directed RNA polymerase subunit n=1 Tax=Aulographum hederae CBS 113979 TaxID=1176131 RepID=A0A6G1HFZ5_9PEZI|nr:DNA-directed RNA polymerase II 19 kDa polypeptide [Aulographum hederae CBS 113979]